MHGAVWSYRAALGDGYGVIDAMRLSSVSGRAASVSGSAAKHMGTAV